MHCMYWKHNVVTKGVTTKKKMAEPAQPPAKSFPTAVLGMGMVILTNYQAEVKQILSLLIKALT